jgi:hypothetical protein
MNYYNTASVHYPNTKEELLEQIEETQPPNNQLGMLSYLHDSWILRQKLSTFLSGREKEDLLQEAKKFKTQYLAEKRWTSENYNGNNNNTNKNNTNKNKNNNNKKRTNKNRNKA